MQTFERGDPIIVATTSHGTRPLSAHNYASPHGEDYVSAVVEYAVVTGTTDLGFLSLKTANGRSRYLKPTDPRVRKPTRIERLLHRARFPKPWWA